MTNSAETLTVRWPDESSRMWTAEFSLNSEKPLITKIGVGATDVVRNAYPQYWANTGKRRGRAGFDEFFDFPGSHPDGTRRFEGAFHPVSATANSVGNRIEALFQRLIRTEMTTGPDRRPAYVRYRSVAAQLDGGSLAVFPPPHGYIAVRDYTTVACPAAKQPSFPASTPCTIIFTIG